MASSSLERLKNVAAHFLPGNKPVHLHPLTPNIFLPRAAAIEPNAIAYKHKASNGTEISRTYREFADRSLGLAYTLKERGHKRVGLLLTNTPSMLEAFFAIGVIENGIQVAVNYRLKKDDVQYILDFAEVDSVIVDREFAHLLEGFQKNVPIYIDEDKGDILDCAYEKLIKEGTAFMKANGGLGWDGLVVEPANEDQTIAIPFTSGTTARPKGVELTHRGGYLAALANVADSNLNANHGECRYLWTLPMFHATGWTFPWAVTAVRGTHYLLRKIDYEEIWDLLDNEKITHYNAAPTVNTLLCNSPKARRLDHEVRVTVAASPPSAALFEKMHSFNLYPVHVYGMTETYGPITKGYYMPEWDKLPKDEKFQKMARQGHGFLTSRAVRVIKTDVPEGTIIDIAKDGKEIGEIVFSGNICCKGYYKDPVATRKLFAGGVLHSGDLAHWHPDGSVQIIDRGKDIIISGGENISSVALEGMLARHPDILEAGVVSVPDEKWGERARAYVTLKSGSKPSGEDIITWAKEKSDISRFMVPREVIVVDELPKTSTGKLQKNVMREWARKDAQSK